MWILHYRFCLILLLLKIIAAQIKTYSSGSCIHVGLTECDQYKPADCYCDELCLSFKDCCTDIYQLEFCGKVQGSECTSGSVRLVGGSTPYEGLVEICIFQSWHPVCESSFFYPEANVTCNWLGYLALADSFDDVSNFLEHTNITNATAYGAVCQGDESRLTECLIDFQFCEEDDIQASVNCVPTGNSSCTSSCNTQLTNSQYRRCCNPENYGNFLQVINEDNDTVYLVCPFGKPDWC